MSDEEGREGTLRNSLKSSTSIELGVACILYQGLEVAIKNPKKKYQDKVSALLSGWERLASLSNGSPGCVNSLADCLYRDTLTLVLKGHWPKLSPATKTHLSVTLQRCVGSLISHSALKKCRDLIGLVNNPWGHPTLTGILNNQEGISDSDVLEFCLSEKESMIFMRLETLCDSKCEDLALKLARACVQCLRSPDTRFHDACTNDERYYILDLYIFLLYKFKNVQEIINELKHLDLKEGLALIRRYSVTKNVNTLPRVHKNSHKVAELAAQYFLAVAMVKSVADTAGLLKDLMTEWVILNCRDDAVMENLANMIRKLIQPAESALHVYIFIEVLVDKFGYSLKSLCIELYIRGLAMDMNELEHQKVVGDEDKVKEIEVRLSYGFLKLADLLKDNIGVSRECFLTAFSLYPTDKTYQQLREMAIASGKLSSPVYQYARKRRAKFTKLRCREERTCKSVYRKKLKFGESDPNCVNPVISTKSFKKYLAEVSGGDLPKSIRTVGQSPPKLAPFENKNSDLEKDQEKSEGASYVNRDCLINPARRDCVENNFAVSRSASQNDTSLPASGACTNRDSRLRIEGLTHAEISTFQKEDIPVDVNTSVRSRSGSLTENDTFFDLVPPPDDVDSSKRSRSRGVDENIVSPKELKSPINSWSRLRSSDDTSSFELHETVSLNTRRRSSRTRLRPQICFCESCGEKRDTNKGAFQRSLSEEYLNEPLQESIRDPSPPMISSDHRDTSTEVIQRLEQNSNISPSKQPCVQFYLISPLKCSSFVNSECPKPVTPQTRLRSRHSVDSSDDSFFKEAKARLSRPGSGKNDVSVIAEDVEVGKYKSLVSLDIAVKTNSNASESINHHEKCKAFHETDCYRDEFPMEVNEKSSSQSDHVNVDESPCKVCSHPHQDTSNNLSSQKSSACVLANDIGAANLLGLSSGLSEIDKSSLNYDVLSAPNEVLDAEKLGLTSQLCDDLAVVLSSPRWHMLSWVLEWSELSSLCERYLKDREGMRTVTKELKYLNIDYNQFKDRPSAVDSKDEYSGIEKGYEQWADAGSEHSDSEYTYSPGDKKSGSMQCREESDSDSSSISQNRKTNLNSPISSQSDSDMKEKSRRKQTFRTLSISDSDTGTQDSRAESLGSDGCYKEKPKRSVPECRRKKIPLVKKIAEKRLNDLSKIRLIVNEDICKNNHDSRNMPNDAKEVMTLFSELEESGRKSNSKQYKHGPYSASTVNLLNTPERREKDSKTLKSLRMFRPNHLKSIPGRICFSSANESSKLKARSNEESITFAPMLSTLNLNPRILLTRADVSSHYLKSKSFSPVIVKNTTLNSQQSAKANGITKSSPCLGEKKCIFSSSRKSNFSKNQRVLEKLDGMRPDFKMITQVMESQLLARTVPGLNTLDMMVPPPSEPTVQVIQLPHNPPSSTSGTHSSASLNTTQKVTATQGVQTSPIISPKITATQGVQTSPVSINSASQKSTFTQISPARLGSVTGEPGPSSVAQHADDRWQPTRINVTTSENITLQNVTTFTSPTSQGEQTFPGVVMETRYCTPNVSSSVSTGTPVTAHIQRVGQPPVGLDGDSVLATPLRRLHQCSSQLLSGSHIPIVKGVSLDIVANLRAEALRSSDQGDSFSPSVGMQRSLQGGASLDSQKVHASKKDGKTYNLTPSPSSRVSTDDKLKTTRVQKVDEDSQTDNVVRSTGICGTDDESGGIILMEDGVTKFVGSGKKQQILKVMKSSASQVASLPKFQQAFGKTIYSSNTPGAVDSSSGTQNASVQDGPGCIPQGTAVAAEKLETAAPGSVLSKGVQTSNLGSPSPSKNCVSGASTSASPLPEAIKSGSTEVSPQVPVLCSIQASVTSVATQSDPPVGTGPIATKFETAAASGQGICQSSAANSETPTNNQKMPLVTSPQTVAALCEAHQTSQQQVTIPVKVGMVSLAASLNEKELLLRNKMTELLNRALGRNIAGINCPTGESTPSDLPSVIKGRNQEGYVSSSSEDTGSESMESSNDQEDSRISNSENVRRVIQSPRVARPIVEIPVEENAVSSVGSHGVTLQRSQQSVSGQVPSVLCSTTSNSSVVTSHVSPTVDAGGNLIAHNTIHPPVSSTTLEQLREFESVLEQVTNTSQMKERKSVLPQSENETTNDLTQQLLLSQTSTPTNSTDFESSNTPSTSFSRESFPSSPPTTSPKGGSTNFGSQTSGLQGSIASSRISSTTPVVVVTTYSQPVASPALSVTSQSSSSPNVTPASTPGKTPPKSSPKSSKSKSMKATPTTTSKTAPVTKPQQKPQEDEETAQRIYAILDQYAEQLKNSPDLINKPAPRRRSNPPINPIGSSKRKKSTPTKLRLSGHPPVLTESSPGGDDPRTAGSEDSSSGITQLPQVHDSPATIPSNSEDTSTHESPHTFQLRRGLNSDSSEARSEVNRTSRGTETGSTLNSVSIAGDAATPESSGGGTPAAGNTTPSPTGAVVAGKSLVVGSATALPLYVPGGVRQVLFPVASGLTASMQGRPVVVTKGSKVIRVHQVTVAGGSPMLAGAVAGAKPLQVSPGATAVQGALVVRQMCVNKAMVTTPSVSAPQVSPLTMVGATSAVKQLKLPVMQAMAGGISSQTLAGVTAQPPVVLPPGSHTISAASFLPTNLKTVQGTSVSESSKESVGTSTVEDNVIGCEEVAGKVNSKQELGSTAAKVESEELIAGSSTSAKTEGDGDELGLNKKDCVSPVDSTVVKKSSLGCETESEEVAGESNISSSKSLPPTSCAINKVGIDSKETLRDVNPKNSSDNKIHSGPSLEQPLKKITEETSVISPPRTVLVPHFHETVLVDALSGKMPQRNAKEDTLSVLQCIDRLSPGKAGIMGVVSKTFIESNKDPRSSPEQGIVVGTSLLHKDNSTGVEKTPERCSNIQPASNTSVGSVTDLNRVPSSSQGTITASAGPQGTSFMSKDSQQRIHIHQSPGNSSSFNHEKKKQDLPLEGQLMHETLEREKNDAGTANKLPQNQSKPIDESSSLSSSVDVGKNLVMDVSVPSRIPKELVPGGDASKTTTPENKSCEERSSEDELERKLTRTLSAANSSDYCFPVKRAQTDSKASDAPWRYVPVVKRVSVTQGKAVPVDSALLRAHVESEACLNLPRMSDSLPDELKEGESDDSGRPNFTPTVDAAHSVKRRLFSDDVLEYSTYSTAKKTEKMKQRVEKINRVPDAIEREFRQTRLELEKELRLQKSLSEECEDLGVDEPSTSDLFPEADLLLDLNPSPSYDQTMPDTSCAQNVDSSEPFSSSDFRSVDSSSSAEGVHLSAGCSKTLNLPGSKAVLRKEKPSPQRQRKYGLRQRVVDKKKWMSVRNHHGTLEYRKVTKDDEKRKPILQRASMGSAGDVGTGSLNGSKALSQSNVNIVTFSSSSGEDSLSQHPAEVAAHTSTPTFSSDMTYSSPQDDTAASPNSQTIEISPAPTAAQKFNITYGKKCQTYGKDYCRRGSKRPKVCRFMNYLCDQGDSRDTCDSWDSSNSVEKESTSESSKCGRTYGMMKETRSPSTSPEEDDDGKSIPDFQETTANHSFSSLLPLSATSKLPNDNREEPVLEGVEDDNAILPPVNGIESDEEKSLPKRNPMGKSLRKHVMEKNAQRMLDKIDLYPRVCLKKWKGKDSITCSRYSLELENVSSTPTGSKHFTCVDRPLLESESSVSSEPSSENSSKTSIEQNLSVGHLGLSKSLVLGKDGELNLQSDCPNVSGLMKSSLRRASLRGHVKKGCPCCNGSPEPKKARALKGEKLSKKGHSGKPCSKLHITKKR